MAEVKPGSQTGGPTPVGGGPILLISELALAYGDLTVLGGFDLSVNEGEFVCLLGPSGCGKTSVLRLVAGLIEPGGGKIHAAGRLVTGPGTDRAMVFQNYGLLPWRTVLGNVEFGLEIQGESRDERRQKSVQQIQRLGLAGFERHYPSELSGGMQQRVGLARAFTKNPKILLMDEPFAAVDMQTREYLQDELLKVWEQVRTTVIFVTHSIDEALYLGDRVLVMGARGGETQADVTVDLPRPRYATDVKASARFGELRGQLREALHSGEGHARASHRRESAGGTDDDGSAK